MCLSLALLQISKRRTLHALFVASALVVLLLPAVVSAQREETHDLLVIANRQNAVTAVTKEFLRQVFLKQVTRWDDDETIRPADLAASSTARKKFSERVLGRSVEAVKSYWQQRVFSGRDIPPPEFATEEAVVEYVSRHPGAIGYVSSGTGVSTAKVLVVQ